jgi:hypothetical protein
MAMCEQLAVVDARNFPLSVSLLPPFGVNGRNVLVGIALSAFIGVLYGPLSPTL